MKSKLSIVQVFHLVARKAGAMQGPASIDTLRHPQLGNEQESEFNHVLTMALEGGSCRKRCQRRKEKGGGKGKGEGSEGGGGTGDMGENGRMGVRGLME